MVKLISVVQILVLTVVSSATAFSQEKEYNRWSIDGQLGVNKAFTYFTPGYRIAPLNLFHAGIGTRYMANHKFGMQIDGALDQFSNTKNSISFTSTYYRASLQGVINLGNALDFQEWTSHVRLLIHAGLGYSILTRSNYKSDEMAHIVAGISPQFKISDRFSIQLDLSTTNNVRQTKTFDLTKNISKAGFSGQILTGTVGFSVYLGKYKKHADWHHAENPLKVKVDSLEKALQTMETRVDLLQVKISKVESDLKDSDEDGVADKFDLEPFSPKNAKVDVKGRQIKEIFLGNQTLDSLRGLFYTVQLGVYSQEVPSEVLKNINPLDTKTMPDGKVRYFSGIFSTQEEAAVKLEEAKKAGINDAFMTAYFRGTRITLVEARTFIHELGEGILQKR